MKEENRSDNNIVQERSELKQKHSQNKENIAIRESGNGEGDKNDTKEMEELNRTDDRSTPPRKD